MFSCSAYFFFPFCSSGVWYCIAWYCRWDLFNLFRFICSHRLLLISIYWCKNNYVKSNKTKQLIWTLNITTIFKSFKTHTITRPLLLILPLTDSHRCTYVLFFIYILKSRHTGRIQKDNFLFFKVHAHRHKIQNKLKHTRMNNYT